MEGETAAMNAKQDSLLQIGINVFMILLAVGGLAYGVKSRMILAPDAPFTLDGILLALVCLTIGGLFSVMLLVQGLREGWVKLPGKKAAAPQTSSEESKPS